MFLTVMRVGFGSHEIFHNLKLQKQRAEGEDVGKEFGKGKKKGDECFRPNIRNQFYLYPS